MGKTSMNRRAFLGSMGVAAAAMAGGCLTGCAPNQKSTEADSVTLKEGEYSWETAPDPILEADIVETVEADVVIVGAGLAGSFAALSAAEEGASVIILQKSSTPMSHGFGASSFDAQVQRENGFEVDLAAWRDKFVDLASGYGDTGYIESMIFNSGRAIDMIMEHLKDRPADFGALLPAPGALTFVWDSPDITDVESRIPDFILKIQKINEELGVTYRFSSPAEQLEKENDRVVAVVAKGPDGYVRAKAKKGVVLATGDIGNNPDMVKKYAPFAVGLPNVYAPADNTGDGHKMALWAGAKMHPGPFTNMIHYDPSILEGGNAPFSGSPYLGVNVNGERYDNEDVPYAQLVNGNISQPDRLRWQIVDKSLLDFNANFGSSVFRGPGFGVANAQEAVEGALKRGSMLKADSLEQLAQNMGFEGKAKETLFKTIERYNELAEKGHDDDFGKNPEYLRYTAVKEPPFYSIKRTPSLLTLPDGICTSPKMEALDERKNPIAGLYCIGNVSHGMFGPDYPADFGGFSLGRAMSSGYTAGKATTDTLPDYKSYAQPLTGAGKEASPSTFPESL